MLAAQRSGADAREVWREGKRVAWASADGAYAAVFNRGSEPVELSLPWADLGVPEPRAVRDCWARADLGADAELRVKLPAHGSALYRLA